MQCIGLYVMYKPVYTAVNILYCVYQMHLIINMLDKDAVLAENLIFSNYSGLFATKAHFLR